MSSAAACLPSPFDFTDLAPHSHTLVRPQDALSRNYDTWHVDDRSLGSGWQATQHGGLLSALASAGRALRENRTPWDLSSYKFRLQHMLVEAALRGGTGNTSPWGNHTVPAPVLLHAVAVRPSVLLPSLLGTFACRDYKEGEEVVRVSGWIVKQSVLASLHVAVSAAIATSLHTQTAGVTRADPYVIIMYPDSAAAHVNAAPPRERPNVCISACNSSAITSSPRALQDSYIVLRAKRAIKKGDELLMAYGSGFWKQKTFCAICWQFARRTSTAFGTFHRCVGAAHRCNRGVHSRCHQSLHGSSDPPPSACCLHSLAARAATSSAPRLLQQLSNLQRFVDIERAELLKLFKFAPWTVPSDVERPHVRLAPSALIPGTVGLHATAVPKADGAVVSYPGALMWSEVQLDFESRYHCPTAVRIRVLDYDVDEKQAKLMGLTKPSDSPNRWRVEVVLVGNPSVGGALINSPRGTGRRPNCQIRTCRPSDVYLYVFNKGIKGKQVQLLSSIVAMHRTDEPMAVGDEYLAAYDSTDADPSRRLFRGKYWSYSDRPDDQYCDVCCCKFDESTADTNPLFLCDPVDARESCSRARHMGCMPAPVAAIFRAHKWRCPSHSASAPLPSSAILSSSQCLSGTPPSAKPARPAPPAALLRAVNSQACLQGTPPGAACAAPTQTPLPVRIARPLINELNDSALSRTDSVRTSAAATAVPAAAGAFEEEDEDENEEEEEWVDEEEDENENEEEEEEEEGQDEKDDSMRSSSDSDPGPMSDHAPSDGGASGGEQSSSESDSSCQPAARPFAAHVQRRRTCSLLSIPSLRSEEAKLDVVKFSAATVQEIRLAFADHGAALKHAKWHIDPKKYDTPAEQRYLARLSKHYQLVRKCCGSPGAIAALQAKGDLAESAKGLEIFESASAFLKHRLAHMKQMAQFDKKLMQTHFQASRGKPPINWHGFYLCVACFTYAIGMARSTAFRSGQTLIVDKREKLSVGPVLASAVAGIHSIISLFPQSLPTDNVAVLPFRTSFQAKAEVEKLMTLQTGQETKISSGTWVRARDHIQQTEGLKVNMKHDKGLAACNDCTMHQNNIEAARQAKNPVQVAAHQRAFANHTQEWIEQRQWFERQKREAIANPHKVNTITLDGMDSAKTNLPHSMRKTKGCEAEPISTRVVGAYCFGCPIPTAAVTVFDDVPAKGANASVTVLEQLITMQYEAMNTKDIEPIVEMAISHPALGLDDAAAVVASSPNAAPAPGPAAAASSSNAAAASSTAAAASRSHAAVAPCSAAAAASSSNAPSPAAAADRTQMHATWSSHREKLKLKEPKTGFAPFMWPERLHLTFDNTSADCKNATFFYFLASLIAIGVYLTISISCLLVGHTHDIVDAMFGVWTTHLKNNDAHSLTELHQLFRDKFAARIYEIDSAIKKAKEKGPGSSPAVIADHLQQLSVDMGIKPVLVHQVFTAEVESWVDPESKPKIEAIASGHIYFLRKEKDAQGEEEVIMYSRNLACSEQISVKDGGVLHPHVAVELGPYSSRLTLMKVKDVQKTDPFRVPPLQVDTTNIRYEIEMQKAASILKPAAIAEIDEILRTMDSNTAALENRCATCHEYQAAAAGVGVISRKHADTNAAAKKHADAQLSKKNKVKGNLTSHLRDPDFEYEHSTLRLTGWWTKWLERVRTVIGPYYVSRNLLAPPGEEVDIHHGRKPHPARLPSDPGAPSLFMQRADCDLFNVIGDPKLGDLIVCRGDTPHEPMWLGIVTAIDNDSEEKQDAAQASKAAASGRKRAAAASRSAAPKQQRRRGQLHASSAAAASNAAGQLPEEDEEKE